MIPDKSQFAALPDPGQATTLDDLAETLRLLKAWAGNPSYETLTGRVNAQRPAAEQVGKTTVVDCFRPGRRRVDTELVVAVVEALHADLGYVTQWRQALRVISGETQAAAQVRVQDALPQDLPDFIGRAAQIDRLLELAQEAPAVVISAMAGMAGVGKTQLAVHLGHRLAAEKEFDQVLFVNLRGFHPDPSQPPVDPGAVLDGFLRLLGVPGQQVPHQLEARTELFRQRLAGHRSLVILDNASDEKQIAPLLPDTPGCITLVTSRRDLGGSERIDVFTPAEALEYLASAVPRIPVGSDPGAAARIARRCGHLPLALALVAGHMRAKPGWTLTDHADWLDERHDDRRLDSGVELALEVSYRNLPAGERELLRLIAQHPGQDFDVRAAAALAGTDLPTAEARMAELAADHLVQVTVPGRYSLHDLVRAYAVGRSADEDRRVDRRAAVTRLLDYYVGVAAAAMNLFDPAEAGRRPVVPDPPVPLPDLTEPLSWLEAERPNLIAVVTHGVADGRPEHTVRMAAILYRYLLGRYHQDAYLVHGHAVRAALQAGDQIAYARALANLATADVYLGRHEAAVHSLEESLRVLRQAGHPIDEARTLNNLGIAETRLGRYREAAEHHRESLDLYRVVGNPVGRARALVNLGNLDSRLDRHEDAAAHFAEALQFSREAGDRSGAGVALSNMGAAEVKAGRLDEAEEHLLEALAVFRELHSRNAQANVLDGLGSLALQHGEFDDALDYHQQALAIFHEIGDRDSEACAHNGLGEAYQAAGRSEKARAEFTEALAIASEEDVDDREEQARAHAGLALADPSRAAEHDAAARELWRELGSPRAGSISERADERT